MKERARVSAQPRLRVVEPGPGGKAKEVLGRCVPDAASCREAGREVASAQHHGAFVKTNLKTNPLNICVRMLPVAVGADDRLIREVLGHVREATLQRTALPAVEGVPDHGGPMFGRCSEHVLIVRARSVVDDQNLLTSVSQTDLVQEPQKLGIGLVRGDNDDHRVQVICAVHRVVHGEVHPAMYKMSEVPRSRPRPSGLFTTLPLNHIVVAP